MRGAHLRRGAAAAVVTAALALGATPAHAAAAPGAAAVQRSAEQEIQARIDEYERRWASGDAAAVAALYTPDAVLVGPDGTVYRGRDAIQGFIEGGLRAGAATNDLATTSLTVLGDVALETGTYELALRDGTVIDRGTYVVLWRKVGGVWYLAADLIRSTGV